MIFPYLECDDAVQVNDKLRISGVKSYISKGEAAVTLVRIKPDTADSFITVTGSPISNKNWFLDWQYSSAGTKTVTIEITTDGAPTTLTKDIVVSTEASDKLFSSDQDLEAIENNVLRYVPEGRNSFKYLHRRAQKEMIGWLNKNGWKKNDGTDVDKSSFVETEQVRFWSTYLTLRLLYKDMSNTPGDVFELKSKLYEKEEHVWREMALLKLDLNGDGVQGTYEGASLTTRNLVRS